MGNAKDWDDNAKTHGFTVDSTPEVGDIAVWEATPGNSFGHVAVVESVNSDGTVNVSEYNKKEDGNYGMRSSVKADHYVDLDGTKSEPDPTPPPQPTSSLRPAMVQRPTTGETDLAAVGPNDTLHFYYNAVGDPRWGDMPIPGPGAYSTPAMTQRQSTGETDIAVQGPNNSLDFYFNTPGSQVWNRLPIAYANAAYSNPAIIQRQNTGETIVAVQGPNHSLDLYINVVGSPAWSRLVVPSVGAFSEPALALRPNGELDIAVQGPNQSLDFYYNPTPGVNNWGRSSVAIPGWAQSAPAMLQRPATGETDIAVEGPSNSLDFYINVQGSGAWGMLQVAGGGTTLSAQNPPAMLQRSTGETDIAVHGPNDRTDLYYNFLGSSSWYILPMAAGGYSLRTPVMTQRPSTGETGVVIVGPNNRLDFYMNEQGKQNWGVLEIVGANGVG